MTALIAKTIIENQYWVVVDGNKKVGNVQASTTGFTVSLHGNSLQFNNTNEIKNKTKIEFEKIRTNKAKVNVPYLDFPTTKNVHNSMFDVKKKLHLFTKTKKSKCYHAAGWFVLSDKDQSEIVFCPKYIFIERYNYKGPFKTEDEAKSYLK